MIKWYSLQHPKSAVIHGSAAKSARIARRSLISAVQAVYGKQYDVESIEVVDTTALTNLSKYKYSKRNDLD